MPSISRKWHVQLGRFIQARQAAYAIPTALSSIRCMNIMKLKLSPLLEYAYYHKSYYEEQSSKDLCVFELVKLAFPDWLIEPVNVRCYFRAIARGEIPASEFFSFFQLESDNGKLWQLIIDQVEARLLMLSVTFLLHFVYLSIFEIRWIDFLSIITKPFQ